MVGVVKGHVVLVLDHPAIFAVVINITVAAEAAAPVVQCDVNAGAGRRPPPYGLSLLGGQRRSCASGTGRLDSSRHLQIHTTSIRGSALCPKNTCDLPLFRDPTCGFFWPTTKRCPGAASPLR